jgi:pimeloyl-ACP methyl ester carboxylesterase
MAVHDVGGPIGFLVATRRPERFRALAISNTFGWPMAGYTAVRRMLKIIASPLFGTVNDLTNAVALFTASRYGVGRHLSKADRRSFLGSWRSRSRRRATQQILAGVLRIDPLMAGIQARRPARADAVRAQERSVRLAGAVRTDPSPNHGGRHRRRAPLPVQRRSLRLCHSDLRLVGGEGGDARCAAAVGQVTHTETTRPGGDHRRVARPRQASRGPRRGRRRGTRPAWSIAWASQMT